MWDKGQTGSKWRCNWFRRRWNRQAARITCRTHAVHFSFNTSVRSSRLEHAFPNLVRLHFHKVPNGNSLPSFSRTQCVVRFCPFLANIIRRFLDNEREKGFMPIKSQILGWWFFYFRRLKWAWVGTWIIVTLQSSFLTLGDVIFYTYMKHISPSSKRGFFSCRHYSVKLPLFSRTKTLWTVNH